MNIIEFPKAKELFSLFFKGIVSGIKEAIEFIAFLFGWMMNVIKNWIS
jgi:hypothetical protein